MISNYNKDVLIHFFHHTMPMEQRLRLMKEHPKAYNELVGGNIVTVVKHEALAYAGVFICTQCGRVMPTTEKPCDHIDECHSCVVERADQ
jgi:hypothetical protein